MKKLFGSDCRNEWLEKLLAAHSPDEKAEALGLISPPPSGHALRRVLKDNPSLTDTGFRNQSEMSSGYFWKERAELFGEADGIAKCVAWLRKYMEPAKAWPGKEYNRIYSQLDCYNVLLTKGKPRLSEGGFIAAILVAGFTYSEWAGARWNVRPWHPLMERAAKRRGEVYHGPKYQKVEGEWVRRGGPNA